MMNVVAGVQPFIAGKKLVPLAVTGDRRLAALPSVPTFKELGYDVQVPGWYAIVARAGTPPAVVQQINADINHIRTIRSSRRSWASSSSMRSGPPSEVERYMKRDADARRGPVIRRLKHFSLITLTALIRRPCHIDQSRA
jgi:tripartite-type tricarboxylate transporter receptor subunit TctC